MNKKDTSNSMAVIFFTVFVDMLGFGILIPVIPLLLADPRSEYFMLPRGYTLQSGYILLGFLTAVFPIMQFLATPILGQLSDKYGRKNILALSLAGTCASYAIFALGIIWKNIPILFIARALDGITGGNIAVAQAAIADISDKNNRVKNFGLMGAAFGLGFIIGPYIGGKLSDPHLVSWFSASTPFWFATLLSFLNVLSVIIFFPETHTTQNKGLSIQWHKSITNIAHAFWMKNLRVLFATSFLFMGGFTFFTTFFSVYLIKKFHFTQGNIGDFFAYIGLLSAFTQIVITRKMSKKFKEYQIVRLSLLGVAIGIISYVFAGAWWHILYIAPILAISNGLTMANMTSLVSKSADNSIQGEILGINASVQALAQAIPPMLSGYIAAVLTPEAPIVVSSLTVVLSAVLFFFLFRSQDHPSHHN